MSFYAYMLQCADGSYYVGHTEALEVRVSLHMNGALKGYTSSRLPVQLVWSSDFPTRYEALSAERQIKGWSRAKKAALVREDWQALQRLAKTAHPSTSSGRTDSGGRNKTQASQAAGGLAETQRVLDSGRQTRAGAH
jgi:predicted GIY-YIG superfamily endonuclease